MRSIKLLVCIALLFASCVDNYDVPGSSSNGGYLVVDGFINSNGSTKFTLTHSVPLGSEIGSAPTELQATVNVESDDNNTYPLTEQGKGVYIANNIPVDTNKKYRIYIKTKNNKEYVSDFVEVRRTPPIGDLTFESQAEKRGVQIYVSTSDPDNAARYYNWDYSETWQYRSYYTSSWEYIEGEAIYNPNRENIFDCWTSSNLKDIVITSTTHLTQDIVQNFPLAFIASSTGKFRVGYRITVRQSALTKEAYDYLVELKRNAEQQGSLFDPQPSDVRGNIHSLDDIEEPVLGYVSAHDLQEKSLFIYGYEVQRFGSHPLAPHCPGVDPMDMLPGDLAQLIETGEYLPADAPPDSQYPDAIPPKVFPIYRPRVCVDCRDRGGTNVKPVDWPHIQPPSTCCPPDE